MAHTVAEHGKRISRIVFIGLLLDILSFTIILPLLPRSLEAYKEREGADASTLLGTLLAHIAHLRAYVQAHSPSSRFLQQGARADLVLLGGLLGSLYSLLQCVIAPVIGRAADRFGRRRTLMYCMAGNIVWTVIWVFAGSFESFLLARVIAGLSEGNVQLSNTIIADVTDPTTRSHGMALVGIAFAVGFTLGPSIGAFFARMPIESKSTRNVFAFAPFAAAAVFSLALLLAESLYLFAKLPETMHFRRSLADSNVTADSGTEDTEIAQPLAEPIHAVDAQTTTENNRTLRRLNILHFAYLFFFSGMEYTLTFLTHDKFDFSNAQQGALLGFIGVTSTVLQGGWVRRIKGQSAHGDKGLVARGMACCAIGLACVAHCAQGVQGAQPAWTLWGGALGFAVASATVVNCLNSMVSLATTDMETGRRLGDFRAAGQIGRALGPVFACSVYWLLGPSTCYSVGAAAVAAISVAFVTLVPARPAVSSTKKHS
ncbi:hypothetical protein GGF48_003752 [Coemansia sp. RSA 921]|nr:hypothetical protein GGF48_003752 [Coemansia sp. RSA 921]KAJ2146956.1 hypothetical protein IW142_001845 [Coemansia sp. RSA 564]KAJ2198224.1 hypothetical protein IW144_002026 [Coemansia sp. RSA 522]